MVAEIIVDVEVAGYSVDRACATGQSLAERVSFSFIFSLLPTPRNTLF